MDLTIGRRVLRNGLVLATTLMTCTALQANEEYKSPPASGAPQGSEKATGAQSGQFGQPGQVGQPGDLGQPGQAKYGDKKQEFVQKALMGGRMEVQMGQLAQQKGQNQEIKKLGEVMVRDHTQANQKLQQIAQTLNISTADQLGQAQDTDKHAKHQEKLAGLRDKSGAEFDQEFVRMAIKHHRKAITAMEKCETELQDTELTSFIQETLPKLRQHLQMAQTAARSVGVDESTIASDVEDSDTATGAPAAGQTGSERPRGSLDQDGASISGDAQLGDRRFDADVNADVDTSPDSAVVDIDADADTDDKVFQKGDGKILGLPTSKTDGKYWGIIPKPGQDDNETDASVEADIDSDASVGGAARSESGTDRDRNIDVDVDVDKD
jgi:putative membrane protein